MNGRELSDYHCIIAYIGPRKMSTNFPVSNENIKTHVWDFLYKNIKQSSFTICIFEQSTFRSDKLLGYIEIKLRSFKPNHTTDHTFTLRTSDRYDEPVSVSLRVHLGEDGSKPFTGPPSELLNYEYEIHRPILIK